MATLVLEHSDLARSARLGAALRDHGHRLDIRRLHRGERVPADLDGIDGIVVMGGGFDPVDDTQPWMGAELALLKAAHEAQTPILGICLGCQLLARALGGSVERLEGGIEFGWHEVALTPVGREDPLLQGIPWRSMQIHHHAWHVTKLPEGAKPLARSARTPIQAWTCGVRTWGIQYHPEASAETIRRWMDEEPQVLAESGQARDAVEAASAAHDVDHARLADRLFERVALLQMPLDRRFAGIAKALHH